ncbi:hypothetical protein GGF43_000400 [Coemansia sp. RSA 2618]|nr:hypothetical protein GGF43_000400 [Coemansia sp. RSA 2618]
MTIHFHEGEPDSRAIDPTHMGPVMAYMSRAEHNGIGDVWFKIYEDGYIPESNHWAIDTLVKEDGKVNLVIPADLAPGQYLPVAQLAVLLMVRPMQPQPKTRQGQR